MCGGYSWGTSLVELLGMDLGDAMVELR